MESYLETDRDKPLAGARCVDGQRNPISEPRMSDISLFSTVMAKTSLLRDKILEPMCFFLKKIFLKAFMHLSFRQPVLFSFGIFLTKS